MEILLQILVAAFLLPHVFSLRCHVCLTQSGSNLPGIPSGASQCDSDKEDTVQCSQYLDRCMTVNGTMSIPHVGSVSFVLKNCSSSLVGCNPQSQFSMCKLLNMTDCSVACCQGDLCDPYHVTEPSSKPNSAAHVKGLTFTFTAILCALVSQSFE
ncbi:hypothetical protein ACROYT_G034367 [Oculina patagonica]